MTKQHYDEPVYWSLPDDGALFKCSSCGVRFSHKDVILVQIPKSDERSVVCVDCIDDDWLMHAVNLGMYKG